METLMPQHSPVATTDKPAAESAGDFFSLPEVERETGISKDCLRVWERRYALAPTDRDSHGRRRYSAAAVAELRQIRQLLDLGFRPRELFRLDRAGRQQLLQQHRPVASPLAADQEQLITLLRANRPLELQCALQQQQQRLGNRVFVCQFVPPLLQAVGEAWLCGRLSIRQEALFSALLQEVLQQNMPSLDRCNQQPLLLLATLPGEHHRLGLLLVAALARARGQRALVLGSALPAAQLQCLAAELSVDIVGLSFSGHQPNHQVRSQLRHLRAGLAPAIALWAGGRGVSRLHPLAGIRRFVSLTATDQALAAWPAAFSEIADETLPS
ncbi:MAG: MerR family transcriptional regulator [Desulfuromonas thiophila]|nr:MerR family transcriptional regulator [Desulfuromonas thiophila]